MGCGLTEIVYQQEIRLAVSDSSNAILNIDFPEPRGENGLLQCGCYTIVIKVWFSAVFFSFSCSAEHNFILFVVLIFEVFCLFLVSWWWWELFILLMLVFDVSITDAEWFRMSCSSDLVHSYVSV